MVDRIDPQARRDALDPACGTGGFLTCALRHMREALREEGRRTSSGCSRPCAPSRRSSSRTCCASPTCCSTASRTRASSATTTRWRAPTSATARATASTSSLTNPPFGGREEDGIETQLPQALPDARDGRPLPGPHHPAAEAGRPRRRRAARRLALRRGRQDAAQGTPDGGVQPPHHRPPAQQRLQTLRQHRHQPALLREGRADQGHLVLRAPRPRGPEGLLDDEAHPHRAPRSPASTGGAAPSARAGRRPTSPGASPPTR